MEFLLTPEALTALITLSLMEIVLGIDNIIFIAILVDKLPEQQRNSIRNLGIFMALFLRVALLFGITFLMGLTEPLFSVFGLELSGRDLILLVGGLFLIGKATLEIHHKVEGAAGDHPLSQTPAQSASKAKALVSMTLVQIILLDIVFSLDSVITAIGMAQQVSIMVIAMVIAMVVMLLSAKKIGDLVDRHPTLKVLALSFLILIGFMLVVEGMGKHIDKGYIYFAMFFAIAVELVNMRVRSKRKQPEA